MKLKGLLIIALLLSFGFLFVGCNEPTPDPEPEVIDPTLTVDTFSFTATVGDTASIGVSVDKGTVEGDVAVVYASNDEDVATVNNQGEISAIAEGTAKITVSLADYPTQKAEVTVTVVAAVVIPPEKTVEDFAPSSIFLLGQSNMLAGSTQTIPVKFVPATGTNQTLIWESSDTSVATVDSEGNVVALKPGTVTITATSALKATVTKQQTITVVEAGENSEIGLRAVEYIKNNMPKYVTGDFALPVYPNEAVVVTWIDALGTQLDGTYVFDTTLTADTTTILTAKVEYVDFVVEESLTLKLVVDADNNNFLVTELITTYLDVYFADYVSGADKVDGDVFLPTTLKGATLTWSTNNADVLTKDGVYTKPNNDTVVELSAMVNSGGVGISLSYDLNVKGYTEAEKIDYLLTEGVLAPFATLASNGDIVLPTSESRFGLKLSWSSDKPEVFDNTGVYANKDLAEDTTVTYTITLTEGDKVFANTTTVAITAKAATDTSKAAYEFSHNDTLKATVPTWFPYGGVNGNTITNLPTDVAGHDGVTIEWYGAEEDFNGLTLKTQYLRYHESKLTAKFVKEGVEPTYLEFVLNTGISQDSEAVYIGGRFSEQSSTVEAEKYDLLNTYSYWDLPVGNPSYKTQQYWSYYSGYTFYINGYYDESDAFVQDASAQRYQYFPMDYMTVYITAVAEDGTPTFDLANLREGNGGNWGIFFVNLTDKVAKIPLATHAAGNDVNGDPWGAQGAREHAITFDGFRKGFTADSEGNIVKGSGKGVLQDALVYTDKFVDIPANGYGMTFKTQENQPIVGNFAHPGTKLTIERYDLAPENDYRAIRFNSNLATAEADLAKLEAGESVDPSTVDAALKNAKFYRNNSRLTALEISYFDDAQFDALVVRSAEAWDALIADIKTQSASETYLIDLLALYSKYEATISEVKDLIVDRAWFEAEYQEKLTTEYAINLSIDGGELYTDSRQEVVDLFLTDLLAHLGAKGYSPMPTDLADFKSQVSTLFTDAFLDQWIYRLYKDDPNHLTVDDNSTQFIRQSAYNAKWLPLLYWLNDTIQIGHNGGRDLLGRVGLPYQFTYLTPSNYAGNVVYVATSYSSRLKEYMLGTYAYPTYKHLFLEETWTIGVTASETKLASLTFTAGDAVVEIPTLVKEGFTFDGWYLDEALTQKATLSAAGLGYKDVNLYAKWVAVVTE